MCTMHPQFQIQNKSKFSIYQFEYKHICILKQGNLEFFITSCGVTLIDLLNVHAILYTHQQLLFKFKGKSTKRKNKENFYSTKLNVHALACGRICRHLSVGGAALSKTIFTLFTLCAQSF